MAGRICEVDDGAPAACSVSEDEGGAGHRQLDIMPIVTDHVHDWLALFFATEQRAKTKAP